MTHNNSKIAVIAVHGVSDQKPFESARAISNLLLDPTTNKKANYTPFCERFFRIMVRPTKVKDIDRSYAKSWIDKKWLSQKWWLSLFPDERGDYTCRRIKTPLNELNKTSFDDIDLDFTRDRLKNYRKNTVYDTVCLEGEHITSDHEAKKVHIYEMYWADLSRLGKGFVHIFGELFQLLFHLSSLGRSIVDSTRIKIRETPELCDRPLDELLKWWGRFQVWTGLTLSLLIPTLNLYLFIAAFSNLSIAKIPEEYLPITTTILVGIVVGIFCLWFFINKLSISFKLLPVLPVFIGIGVAFFLHQLFNTTKYIPDLYYYLITIICCLLLVGVSWIFLIEPFNRHRPDTKGFVLIIGIFLIACTFSLFFKQQFSTIPEILTGFSLNFIEVTYLVLVLAWLGFNVLYCITMVLWLLSFIYLNYRVKKAFQNRPRVKQALREKFQKTFLITQFSLVLPTVLFLFFAFVLWQILASFSSSLFLSIRFYQPIIFSSVIQKPTTSELFKEIITPSEFLNRLMLFSHSSVTNGISLAVIIVFGIIVCSLLPAIWTDIQPSKKPAVETDSIELGNWLTKGFDTIVFLIILSILIAPIIALLSNISTISNIFQPVSDFVGLILSFFEELIPNNIFQFISNLFEDSSQTPLVFQIAVSIIVGSATSLIALGNRLNRVFLGLRGILDTMLDVDNYLRLHPKNDTPRARIFARYLSLLRYLYHWKDPQDNKPYDAIFIVSHSQGTVITADLLRLLSVDLDDSLLPSKYKKPPIYILTMGSPLKQLYGFAFPDLYSWIFNPKQLLEQFPNVNVKEWVNTYRSGDYIGRNIWASSKNKNLYRLKKKKFKRNKPKSFRRMQIREYCIGAGGHTHYWNINAPEIAEEVDDLISKIAHQSEE